jgi:hypothetical protein
VFVLVGVDVLVAVGGTGVAVFVGVGVGVRVDVAVAVFVEVDVGGTGVFVAVGVLVGVDVRVGVRVGVLVLVFVGVGVTVLSHLKLRSSLRLPLPSRYCVRMCIGEPLIAQAPPPLSQYALDARWPPQTRTTSHPPPPQALPGLFTVNDTTMSAVPVPPLNHGFGECDGVEIELIVPP